MSGFKQTSTSGTGVGKYGRQTGQDIESSNWRAAPTPQTNEWVVVKATKPVPTTVGSVRYTHYERPRYSNGPSGSGGSGSSSATTRTDVKSGGQHKPRGYNHKTAIKSWAGSSKACVDMIGEYSSNIGSWEAPQSSGANRLTMIKELARNLRHDVLGELIRLNPKFSSGLSVKGFTPLQYVGYPNKSVAKQATLTDLIATASVLIDGYRFKIFTGCDEEAHEKETIFGALQTRHNPLPEELRLAFYDYLTQEAEAHWFLPNFKGNLSKLSPSNAETFQNKFLAVLSRFPLEAAKVFFFQLMMIRAPKAERLFLVELPVKTLLSSPTSTDYEMNRYFGTTDVRAAQTEFVSEIMAKGEEWILADASEFAVGSEAHVDRVALNSRIYFSVLGCIYAQGFAKSEILDLVNQLISDDSRSSRPSWTSGAIVMFMIHANIVYGSTSADAVESKLLVDFIKSCYNTSSLRDKVFIETGTGMTPSQIKSLIVDTTAVVATGVDDSRVDEPDWDKIMAEVGDEVADFD